MMVAAGILAYATPGLAPQIVYDRSAILSGEVWRLLTGNWVHFSPSHLFYDLATLGTAGWIIERRGYPYYGGLCTLSAFFIGAVLLAAQPDIHFYGGLSGVASGAVIYLALRGVQEAGSWRWICLTVLLLTTGKIAVESATNEFILVVAESLPFAPVPLSHIVGGLTGLLIFCWPSVSATFKRLGRKATMFDTGCHQW